MLSIPFNLLQHVAQSVEIAAWLSFAKFTAAPVQFSLPATKRASGVASSWKFIESHKEGSRSFVPVRYTAS